MQQPAATFSSAVLITDLDDFITPSQACIKPVKLDKSSASQSGDKAGIERIDLDSSTDTFVQINRDGSKQQLQKTKIELSDCLACSGCVTSAESILVNQQSVEQFLTTCSELQQQQRQLVVSISPQSRASLAAYYGIKDPVEAQKRIIAFCKTHLNASHVFDTTWSRHLALLEMCQEFVQHYRKNSAAAPTLPLLTSACPGWICYAEKTQHDVLPFVSTVKSPQQIMGSLVKDHFGSSIYHVSIMPCFDKKLEASRDDFRVNGQEDVPEVDLVLTTSELDQLLRRKGFSSLRDVPAAESIDPLFNEVSNMSGISGSGGYLETVFRYAAQTLFGRTVQGPLEYKAGRNDDMKEVYLEIEGQKVLHFALAYGFRNIQNIVRKLGNKGRTRLPYHFVEVMACPSGCLNGGGQMNAPEGIPRRDFFKQVKDVYTSAPIVHDLPSVDAVQSVYRDVLGVQNLENSEAAEAPSSEKTRTALHTQYHAREKLNLNPLQLKW